MSVEGKRIMRMAEIEQLTGLNKRTIYRYIRDNKFPKPIRLGSRVSGWLVSDVVGWLNNLSDSRVDHLEGDTWVTYKTERTAFDVKVGDTVGHVTVRRVEVRE